MAKFTPKDMVEYTLYRQSAERISNQFHPTDFKALLTHEFYSPYLSHHLHRLMSEFEANEAIEGNYIYCQYIKDWLDKDETLF